MGYGEAVNNIAYGLVGARDLPSSLDEHRCRSALFRRSSASGLHCQYGVQEDHDQSPPDGGSSVSSGSSDSSRDCRCPVAEGQTKRASSRCTQTSRLTTSARRCSLRPKPSANERCPSPPANEVPDRQCSFASARSSPATGRSRCNPRSLNRIAARRRRCDLRASCRRASNRVSADADFGTLLAVRSSRQPSVIQFRGEGSRKPDALARTLLANLPQLVDAVENGSTSRAAELHQERAAVRTPYAGIST